ncbi:MAG: dTDP-4-dehydrorhamnose 3,5-epimerase [Alphaproteobacteria bacterium]|nr:dTDP-4-dehydrorhamnose 3,5-epimerase [Alphaproteobacteria bacterium]
MAPVVSDLGLSGLRVVQPRRFADERGFFCETFNARRFAEETGFSPAFVQDNMSLSRPPGTLRGLHFQTNPAAQAKLVSVARGAILDVAVDLRRDSPTFGRHAAIELSAENGRQLFVPCGFAHGFCTLEPDTLVTYKVTGFYSAANDSGLAWDDPDLGIAWPVSPAAVVLSDKDRVHPRLAELPPLFSMADPPF